MRSMFTEDGKFDIKIGRCIEIAKDNFQMLNNVLSNRGKNKKYIEI